MSRHKRVAARQERQERRNKRMIAIFVSALMILSVAGIIAGNLSDDSAADPYSGFGITYMAQPNDVQQRYELLLDDEVYHFWTPPEYVTTLDYDYDALTRAADAQGLVIMFDPSSSLEALSVLDIVRFEMGQTWIDKFGKQIGFVLSANDTTGTYMFPVVDCLEADQNSVVLDFVENRNITSLRSSAQNPYCIIAQGVPQDFTSFRDLIAYKELGVI